MVLVEVDSRSFRLSQTARQFLSILVSIGLQSALRDYPFATAHSTQPVRWEFVEVRRRARFSFNPLPYRYVPSCSFLHYTHHKLT